MPVDLIPEAYQWTVSSGGTTAPAAGTVEQWTVSGSGLPTATSGISQFSVVDLADANWPPEIIPITNTNGGTWTAVRGGEGAAPWAHAANWTAVPVASPNMIKQALTSVPLVGAALALWGHSLAANGGATGDVLTKGWENLVSEMLRGRLWNQSAGGAVLGKSGLTRGAAGWGGVMQVLQGLMPNPYSGTNWRGAYSSSATYAVNDGVSSGGNWYRNETSGPITNVTPGTGSWTQLTSPPGTSTVGAMAGSPAYPGLPFLPVFWFGTNDQNEVFQGNDQAFLSAMESILVAACAAAIYDSTSPMIALSGGTFTLFNYTGTSLGGMLAAAEQFPNTAGAAATFTTPLDWPGGYVTFRFFIGGSSTGTLNFTVDGVNTNVLNSGSSGSTSTVNFGSPGRFHIDGTALTTALAAGVAVTTLAVNAFPEGLPSGTVITVGAPGSTDSFTLSGVVSANATSLPVTSHAPTNAHPINDPVSAGTFSTNVVVRVPVPAGSHAVAATVPASPNIAGVNLDGVVLESPNPPPIIVMGLPYLTSYSFFWSSRNGNDALTDTWNTDLKALLANFPSAYFLDTSTLTRNGAKLSTALTAGQTAVTSLALQQPGLPYAVAAGDSIAIGSGTTLQYVTASGAAAVGALSVPVNSFTSTYAQPVGTWVWDSTVIQANYFDDGIHYSNAGHNIIAQAFIGALRAAIRPLTPQQTAGLGSPSRVGFVVQRYTTANLVVGTGVASGWGRVGASVPIQLAVPADPGDLIEVNLEALWDSPATVGTLGGLDFATLNPNTGTAINFFSGMSWAGSAGVPYLGLDAVGAQLSNGCTSLLSGGNGGNQFDHASGVIPYVVQFADIQQGYVYVALWGKSSSATVNRNLLLGSANQFVWTARNYGPVSYVGESG